jgi:large subunit ribosomal protein L24
MKQKFSTAWKASSQPRKQRKYMFNAPLHLKRKFLSINLAKPLRSKYKKRSIVVVKGDTVKIMRGKFKKKQGKVSQIKMKLLKVYVEGIQIKKKDGSSVNVPLQASNLQIIELNLNDKKRLKTETAKETKQEKTEMKEEQKTQSKPKPKENKK